MILEKKIVKLTNPELFIIYWKFLSEPAWYWKANKGWGCVEKEAAAKLNIQYIKNNLQREKGILMFIF